MAGHVCRSPAIGQLDMTKAVDPIMWYHFKSNINWCFQFCKVDYSWFLCRAQDQVWFFFFSFPAAICQALCASSTSDVFTGTFVPKKQKVTCRLNRYHRRSASFRARWSGRVGSKTFLPVWRQMLNKEPLPYHHDFRTISCLTLGNPLPYLETKAIIFVNTEQIYAWQQARRHSMRQAGLRMRNTALKRLAPSPRLTKQTKLVYHWSRREAERWREGKTTQHCSTLNSILTSVTRDQAYVLVRSQGRGLYRALETRA